MKLTTANVDQTLNRFDAKVVPEDHPVAERLITLFGEHTFFLDRSGLSIVEPAEAPEGDVVSGRVIKLAKWTDASRTSLTPHDPEVTQIVVPFSHAA